MLGEKVSHHHGQRGHENAIDKVNGVEKLREPGAARHPGANEEKDQTQFPHGLEGGVPGHQVDRTDPAKVPKDQTGQQAAACGGQGKVPHLAAAHHDAADNGQGQRHEPELIQTDPPGPSGGVLGDLGQPVPFPVQIRVGELGDQLDKEDHPHHPEEVGDAVAHGDQGLQLRGGHRGLGCGESGGGGESSGQKAHQDGGELRVGQSGEGTADEDAEYAGYPAKQGDHQPQAHIRLEVLFEIVDKPGARNEADGGDKEHEPQILHNLQPVGDKGGPCYGELFR